MVQTTIRPTMDAASIIETNRVEAAAFYLRMRRMVALGQFKRVAREAMEETGYAVSGLTHLFDTYSSPGTLTERVSCFAAHIDSAKREGRGGGVDGEGEDIEIVEMPIDEACALIPTGGIVDAKTIMMLQWLMLNREFA